MSDETFLIHDNGGRPFKVVVTDDRVCVYYEIVGNDVSVRQYSDVAALTINAHEVFVGADHNADNKGNSILVRYGDEPCSYVFIGETIFIFRTLAPILNYHSPIGNSDVPYPYAIDCDDNYYLLTENVVLLNQPNLQDNWPSGTTAADPYAYYYAAHLLTPDSGYVVPRQPMHPHFRMIDTHFVGQDCYTLQYSGDAEAQYDFTMGWADGPMSIRKTDGSVEELTRDSYIELMEAFGEHADFAHIPDKHVICKRDSTIFDTDRLPLA